MNIFSRYTWMYRDNTDIGIFILRLFIGLRLIYGVLDNIVSWDRMIDFSEFLSNHSFPFPLMSAVASVYIQFFCSIAILLGYKVRMASYLLIINFIVAIIFVHIRSHDSIEVMTPALAMLFGCITLFCTGGYKISLDSFFELKKESKDV